MIAGIGVDIVVIERIRDLINRHGDRFLERIFSPEEIAICKRRNDPAPGLAARFAAKEAFVKAIGSGMVNGMHFYDVQVQGDGPPKLILCGKALELAEIKGIRAMHVSLSHERDHAVAMVVVEV